MNSPSGSSATARLLLAAPLLSGLFWAAGCDNYACVFGPGNCSGNRGGSGGAANAASQPSDGSWIRLGAPELVDYAPRGSTAHPQTVITLEFSESLAAGSLQGAFEVFDSVFSTPVPFIDPPPLVADGRIVVLVPLAALERERSYLIRLRENAQVSDLTGQVLARAGNGDLGNFAVAAEPPAQPQVIATWPSADAIDQSDLGEIAIFFDRKMVATSFTPESFVVSADGLPPTNDPNPVPLLITGGQVPITVTQVWRYRSVDVDGEAVSLGAGVPVEVVLSPEGAALTADDGAELEPLTLNYEISELAVPLALSKHPLAAPEDALGLSNLDGPNPVLQVELADVAVPTDELTLYCFGVGPVENDPLIALVREVTIEDEAQLIDILATELDLLAEDAPERGRFATGDLTIAVSHTRDGHETPVRLFDADLEEAGAQRLLFDVTRPELLGLGLAGEELDIYRSDLSGVVIAGRASERIRQAVVRLYEDGFHNGDFPDNKVAVADDDGFFVASPVLDGSGQPLTLVSGLHPFTLQIYDEALNGLAVQIDATFRQRGGVGPEVLQPGELVRVHVFDAHSLRPLSGAIVLSQQDDLTISNLDNQLTNSAGEAQVMSATSGRTLVSVALAGYGLFTAHGLRSERLHVPLEPNVLPARSAGNVRAQLPAADISFLTNFISDSRFALGGDVLAPVAICTPDPITFTLNCPFGPVAIRARRPGAQSLLSGDYNITFGTFSAGAFLRSFALRLALPPLEPNALEAGLFVLNDLLSTMPAAEQAVAIEEQLLSGPPGAQAGVFGEPTLTVEGVCAGLPGAVAVGLGAAFEVQDQWSVLGAFAGAARGGTDADNYGSLVEQGTLRPDLYLRAELSDADGNRVGQRPRLSLLDGELSPPDVPVLQSPVGATGGGAFDLVFDQVLLDEYSAAASGLYRATLVDSSRRRWTLWRWDELDGAATLSLHVPDLGADGLSPGLVSCQVSAFTWPSFDPGVFLWTDVEREYDHFAHSAVVTFTH